ncbi:Inversin [Madurella fahalii]|uniref:Inversin n=1 Tax=Madurella fahalii TaxID=1157608 RepID=A0ABQ0FZG9_9PEZI
MAGQITVHEKGFTVLYEAPDPLVDIIFVHGFTGHPKRTWTLKGAKLQSADPAKSKKHGPDDEPIDTARRFKIPRPGGLFKRSSSARSTATSSILASSPAPVTDNANSESQVGPEGPQREVYWPQDLAPKTAPNSRIFTYGYDTNVRHWFGGAVSRKSVYDHAWDFLCSLEALRRDPKERRRPVLFIAHSLGGIVVKEALRRSRGCGQTKPHLHAIFEATIGALFFGTPHGGADPRGFLHHVLSVSVQALGVQVNKQIVDTLMPDAERLPELKNEFSVMCHERKWQVYSFQEEYGVRALFQRKVVDDQSSCLNEPTIETKQHISSNHMDMCRFSGLPDPEYSKVAAAMAFILGKINNSTHTVSPELSPPHIQPQDERCITYDERIARQPSIPRAQSPGTPSLQETRSWRDKPAIEGDSAIPADIKQSLIDQLYFDKIDERLTSLMPAQGKTCRWFLAKEEYASWRDPARLADHGGFLWIKGNPGTGKSTLMKLLFEEAKLGSRSDPSQITLSFFFLARGTLEEKSTTGLYRSLLHKLFEKVAGLKDSLEWLEADGARIMLSNGWHKEALKLTLTHAIRKLGHSSLTIFVDALDECNDDEAEDMVFFFEDLCELAQEIQIRLRICFSSRHYPHIEIKKGIKVILEDEVGHEEDIKHYIKSKLRLRKTKGAESLQSEILENSSMIFLWVVLVIDILNSEYPGKPIEKMRKRLREIPQKLADLFEMILARDEENPELLQLCLQWILFATRPLKPQELYFAVQFGLDKTCSGCWDQETLDLDQMKTFVRSSSKGLAEVTRNKASEVQFIHESVRDFLLGKYGGQWSEAASGSFVGHGHQVLRDCCLAQVLSASASQSFGIPTNSAQNTEQLWAASSLELPFLKYSTLNMLHHANSAQQHGMEQSVFLDEFPLQQWAILHNAFEKFAIRKYKESISLLYILAERNLAYLIKAYPRNESCFDVGDEHERYGPPILAALATGSDDAAQALLETLARVQSPQPQLLDLLKQWPQKKLPGPGYSLTFSRQRGVLSYIAEHGNEVILSFLLHFTRVETNSLDHNGHGPLWYAVTRGHESVARTLLENGANPDAPNKAGETPLLTAVRAGHEAIVRLLLEHGVGANAADKRGNTSLQSAIRAGREAIVRLLLEYGADASAADIVGKTLLMSAVRAGHEAIVRLLLEHGADANAAAKWGDTPLLFGVRAGREAIVRLLLEHGADANAADKRGNTLLLSAVQDGHEAIVRLFLENGAWIDSRDSTGRTALIWAAGRGYQAIHWYMLPRKGSWRL